ncbi:MAG: VWA domain-containing protein [Candidatus Methylacidiphilales bacterium]|nr:VWA domain-containing protein [Candidatus Methylacidiphilales bacterium]
MEFEYTYWLWAGAAVVIVLAILFYRASASRKGALQKFLAPHLIQALTSSVSPERRRFKMVLLLLGIALLFVAMARPRVPGVMKDRVRRGIDMMIAIDTSKSMMADDVKPNRLTRAKLAVNDLLNSVGGDRVGLIAFAGAPFLQCPLTLDFDNFRDALNVLDTSIIPKGGTDIGAAIREALAAFQSMPGSSNYKILILITDGEDLAGRALEDAKNAAAKGLRIYTIGVGTAAGENIQQVDDMGQLTLVKDPTTGNPVRSRLDETTLTAIADATGGVYMPLGGVGDLQKIYTKYLEPLPKQELSKRKERVYEEYFQYPLMLALVCFIVEYMLSNRKLSSHREPEGPPQKGRRRASSNKGGIRKANAPATGTAPSSAPPATSPPYTPPAGTGGRMRPATMSRTQAWMALLLSVALLSMGAARVFAQDDSSSTDGAPRLEPTKKLDQKSPEIGSRLKAATGTKGGSPQKAEQAYKEGKFKDALDQYKSSLEANPTPEMAFNIGAAAYKSQDYETAAMAFDGAMHTSDLGLQQRAYYNMGNTLFRVGEPTEQLAPDKTIEAWEKSVKQYDSALKLNPRDADAKFNRDFVKQRLDRLKQQQKKDDKKDNKKDKDMDKDKDQKKDKDDEKKDDKGGDGGKGNDKDQSGQGEGKKDSKEGGGNGEGDDKKQDGQQGEDPNKEQKGKGGQGDQKDESGKQQQNQGNKGEDKGDKGQGKGQQPNDKKDKGGQQANQGDSGQDKQPANEQPQQPQAHGDQPGDQGQDKPEPGKGEAKPAKAAQPDQDDKQPEPGSMSKKEAQDLLDSLKDEEQRFPIGDMPPATDGNYRDW